MFVLAGTGVSASMGQRPGDACGGRRAIIAD
jgi:hypothetical protein